MSATEGTFKCPICGFDKPHSHSKEDQNYYRAKQIFEATYRDLSRTNWGMHMPQSCKPKNWESLGTWTKWDPVSGYLDPVMQDLFLFTYRVLKHAGMLDSTEDYKAKVEL